MSGAIDIRKLPAYQKGYRDGFLEGQRIGLEIARKTIESRTTSYQLVQPRDGGPYSLFCYNCRRWIPNTAKHEMQKEGAYAHGHICAKLDDGSVVVLMEDGIPEGEEEK